MSGQSPVIATSHSNPPSEENKTCCQNNLLPYWAMAVHYMPKVAIWFGVLLLCLGIIITSVAYAGKENHNNEWRLLGPIALGAGSGFVILGLTWLLWRYQAGRNYENRDLETSVSPRLGKRRGSPGRMTSYGTRSVSPGGSPCSRTTHNSCNKTPEPRYLAPHSSNVDEPHLGEKADLGFINPNYLEDTNSAILPGHLAVQLTSISDCDESEKCQENAPISEKMTSESYVEANNETDASKSHMKTAQHQVTKKAMVSGRDNPAFHTAPSDKDSDIRIEPLTSKATDCNTTCPLSDN